MIVSSVSEAVYLNGYLTRVGLSTSIYLTIQFCMWNIIYMAHSIVAFITNPPYCMSRFQEKKLDLKAFSEVP